MIKSKELLENDEYQREVFSTDISNCPQFSGYLSRKSSKGFWQKRWFYLNNQFLIYKKDEVTPDVKGVLSLHEISFVKTDDCILEMTMSDGSYKLLLRGESNYEMKAWESHIYERITWYNSQLQEEVISYDEVVENDYGHENENVVKKDDEEKEKSGDNDPIDTVRDEESGHSSVDDIPVQSLNTPLQPATAPREFRQLVVELVRAKNLVGCMKNGMSCPVVTLKLLGFTGKEIPNESATTIPKPATTQPSWEQLFIFGSKEFGINVSALGLPSLLLEVHHKPDSLVVVEKPMGKVVVPLSKLSLDGSSLEEWFSLEKLGRMAVVSGELLLKMKWIKLPSDKANETTQNTTNAATASMQKDTTELKQQNTNVKGDENVMSQYLTDKMFADFDSNELVVTVFKCQNLRWTKKKGLPNPVVNLKINENKKQWSIASKTLNPVWNETYFFNVRDPSMSLTVSIEYNELVKNTFVGQTVISLRPLQNKSVSRQWYKLRNAYGEVSSVDLGNIEIGLVWRYNPDATTENRNKASVLTLKGIGLGADSDTDVSEEGDEEETSTFAIASTEATNRLATENAKLKSLLMAEISTQKSLKSGDYQVQVHIVEVAELAPKNLNGLSDPVVFVEVNGEKQKTATLKNCLSAVYDEVFIFNLKHMEKEELERMVINIKVYDANVLTKSVLIGSHAVDVEAVYMKKDHEIYRQWAGLTNHEDVTANSFQGYVKYSIQVVGENDVMKIHDEAEENRKEANQRMKDVCPLKHIVAPPNILKEWVFLVVAVYEADYLPVMDRSFVAFKKDGTDAYAEVQFSSNNPIRTRVKTLKGNTREAMSPTFNYELWVPVCIPASSNHISFTMWDHEVGTANDLIGAHYTSLKRLLRRPRDPVTGHDQSTGLYWANIYGAHKSTRDEVWESLKNGVNTAHAVLKQVDSRDYKEYYNRSPSISPSYNGRVLISQRIASPLHRPKKYLSENMEPFMKSIRKLNPQFLPLVKKYKLKAILVRGSDMPSYFTLKGEGGANDFQKLQVKISVGKHEIVSKQVNCVGRNCQWGELMESEDILLPEDISQVPDVFVYLVTAFTEFSSHRDPICYKRFSVADIIKKNFKAPCEWVMLNKDRAVSGISDSERPGSLLIKLGFGLSEVEEKNRPEWESTLLRQKRRTPYQVRVNLYQGKNFPATDDNGLSDPYLKFNLLGETKQSAVKYKTRFPLYYETLTFDCLLPDTEFLPLLECQVYDKDVMFDDYVGRFSFHLGEAFELDSLDDALVDPHYIPIFIDTPGDGHGEVLMSVQLIQKKPNVVLTTPPSLVPETRLAMVEITALGLRNMQPFKFQKMVSPFVEVFVQSIGGKHLIGTEPSKTPSSANPNYLEQFTVEMKLPRNALYAVPLMIVAKDVRLGGLSRPEVGTSYVDMTNKMPWSKTYVAPQSNVFHQDSLDMREGFMCTAQPDTNDCAQRLDDVGKEALSFHLKRKKEILDDDYIVTQDALYVTKLLKQRMEEEDSGVGVFGALSHLALPEFGGHRKKSADDYFADIDWDEDDSDDESSPKYMEGRIVLEEELEKKLKTSPFETYKFSRGSKSGPFPSFKNNVGIFKGLIRVYLDADSSPPFDMGQLRSPQVYVCRLYVLRGLNLTPMDPGFGGRPGKSDPYLKVKLGDVIFDDRKNTVDDATDVDFYKMIEFGCELPGVSQLTIQVFDHDFIGSDDLIGETVIDLEDRWFDNKWQAIGSENKIDPSGFSEKTPRWNTKDLERRTLYVPTSNASQGVVECWLDIMTPGEANVFPPDDVALPPKQIFEVRLVIWKCKDVPAADTFGGQNMTDMYVRSWIEGCDHQDTDTHWRAKKGKGSFNWRMKFDVELGHNTRAMKFPYLHLQLWDRDLLKWNDCMAEVTVNLGAYFKKAFKKQVALKLFETERLSPRVKKQRKAAARYKSKHKVDVNKFNIPDSPFPEPEINEEDGLEEINKEDIDADRNSLDEIEEKESKMSSFLSYFKRKKEYSSAPSNEEKNYNEKIGYESKPLLSEEVVDNKEADDSTDQMEFVKMIKNMTGLWDEDPNDSEWLFLDRLDHETGIREPMGKLCYGLQIWPKKMATVMPVGNGRQSPNQDPFLPPPVGRLQFSWNPFIMGADLCGPKMCFKLSCCLLCIGFTALLVFCQPVLNLIIALLIR